MKWLFISLAGLTLLVFANGCEVTPTYGGGYAVYGEYPYYEGDYYYPAYRYGFWHRDWDRDHYWDRGHWERHPYRYHYSHGSYRGGRERGEEHHH